jgi:hypothetical protein
MAIAIHMSFYGDCHMPDRIIGLWAYFGDQEADGFTLVTKRSMGLPW